MGHLTAGLTAGLAVAVRRRIRADERVVGRIEARSGVIQQTGRRGERARDEIERPEGSSSYGGASRPGVRRMGIRVADVETSPAAASGVDELETLVGIDHHRLLDQDVDASEQRIAGEREVRLVRRRDHDGVDTHVEHGIEVRHGATPERVGSAVGSLELAVGDRNDPGPLVGGKRREVDTRGPPASTDDSDPGRHHVAPLRSMSASAWSSSATNPSSTTSHGDRR